MASSSTFHWLSTRLRGPAGEERLGEAEVALAGGGAAQSALAGGEDDQVGVQLPGAGDLLGRDRPVGLQRRGSALASGSGARIRAVR